MSDEPESPTSPAEHSGVVLFAGGTDFENMMKRPSKGSKLSESGQERSEFYQDLLAPHRLFSLDQIRIKSIASGCAALHILAIDVDGNAWVWGRNIEGQLGLGDRIQRNQPTKLSELQDVSWGACGRAHTVLIASNGKAYSSGDNKFGQLGNNTNVAQIDTFGPVSISKSVKKAACGADFTLLLTREGTLYACGSGENGCLGDGSTHTYNSKNASIKMEVEPQPRPRPISGLDHVVNVAAGVNHAVCLTDDGSVFSWGCGDYGRLGHGVQKDELRPRAIDWFQGQRAAQADSILTCGGTSTIVSGAHGAFWWGKVKNSGDAMMSPTMCNDLRGWQVRSVSASKATFGVAAETSTIIWGQAFRGELAGGVNGKKTSAMPAKCFPLEGMTCLQIACGNGFTVFLMDDSPRNSQKKISAFEVYEAPELDPFHNSAEPEAPVKKVTVAKKPARTNKRKRTT